MKNLQLSLPPDRYEPGTKRFQYGIIQHCGNCKAHIEKTKANGHFCAEKIKYSNRQSWSADLLAP